MCICLFKTYPLLNSDTIEPAIMRGEIDGEYLLPVPSLNCTIISFDLSSGQAPEIMQGDGDPSPSRLVVGAAIRGHDAVVVLPETAKARGGGDGQFISIESSRPVINCKIERKSVRHSVKALDCGMHVKYLLGGFLVRYCSSTLFRPRKSHVTFPCPFGNPLGFV